MHQDSQADSHESAVDGQRRSHGTDEGDAPQNGDVDDQFRALLEGLRTTLPGVQVLFAFLLTLPFQGSFADLGAVGRNAFIVAFGAAAVSSILLIAPSVHQRIRAPLTGLERHSQRHLRIAVWLTIAGTATFLVALAAAVFLVADVVFDDTVAIVAVTTVACLAGWSWIYLPAVSFERQ